MIRVTNGIYLFLVYLIINVNKNGIFNLFVEQRRIIFTDVRKLE